MFKNVASQKIEVFVFDSATGLPKTGDAANLTLYVSKDHGTLTALTDTSATEISATNAKGWYRFDLTQSETDANNLLFAGVSSTSGCVLQGQRIFTVPANFTTLGIDSGGNVKIQGTLKKNTAIPGFIIFCTDSTSHNPLPGQTGISVARSLDGGAFSGGTLGAVSEISDGYYKFDIGAGDMNGTTVAFKITKSGMDLLPLSFLITP